MLLKVRQGAILEAIRYSRATYGLLAHTGNHLRDINERPCMCTEETDEKGKQSAKTKINSEKEKRKLICVKISNLASI